MKDISKEDTGEASETEKETIYEVYQRLLKDVKPLPGKTPSETYEEDSKNRFIKEPASMKLLVVVDKLLTGFDAPPCSYLYIDKSMQDHGLFQAICRTNRLDDEDKEFGNIVDYMDLFRKVENAIAVYSSELDDSAGSVCPQVKMKDRLTRGRERLEEVMEALDLLCEAVEQPKADLDYIHYFCGNTEIASDLQEREPQRVSLYRHVASLVRAYANLSDEMSAAGYSTQECARIENSVRHYVDVREHIRNASGESLDVKAFEADMRHLIDNFIEAERPQKISDFDNLSLVELIVKTGVADAIAKRLGKLRHHEGAIAETIENNVRSKIIREHLNDPAFYDRMSMLLEEIIADRRRKAMDYETYLKRVADLAKQLCSGHQDDLPEVLKQSPALRALYNNLESFAEQRVAEGKGNYNKDQLLELAVEIDATVRREKPDNFRGNEAKERKIMEALLPLLNQNVEEVIRIFEIIKKQAEY